MLFQPSDQSLTVHAPAKLNLFLEVRGRRADGYHELETFMVSVDLHDTLRFRNTDSGQIRLKVADANRRGAIAANPDDHVPVDERNLVVAAARLLQRHAGTQRGVHIDLAKRIPVSAGLGGGSSDAAATLGGLNRFWRLNLPPDELSRLAIQLGSDVGFFLARSTAAICRGRGEIIEPILVPRRLHFVIVRPRTGLSTAEVYGHCRPPDQPRSCGELVRALEAGRLSRAAGQFYNRLQISAEELNTEVLRLKEVFSKQPVLGHLMSGSGTGYFGLSLHRSQARAVAARLQAARIGRVCVAQSSA